MAVRNSRVTKRYSGLLQRLKGSISGQVRMRYRAGTQRRDTFSGSRSGVSGTTQRTVTVHRVVPLTPLRTHKASPSAACAAL